MLEANEIKPYFRVNSLFFDPNIYGRFLALTMIVLAASLPALRRGRQIGLVAAALAVLWAGMVLSLSQSSFAALLLGLLVLAALRWRPLVVVGAVVAALVVGRRGRGRRRARAGRAAHRTRRRASIARPAAGRT